MKLIKEWFVFIKKCIYLTKEPKQPSNKKRPFFCRGKSLIINLSYCFCFVSEIINQML